MSFTQVALTGTVTLSNGSPAAGASVNFTLNTPITDGTSIIAPLELTTRCANDGTFTITLNANDDTTTLPTGTFYAVSIGYGTQTIDSFNVIVPHADAPTVNLFTLATLPNPSVVNPYVSQLVAGAGISLSPVGGTGVVTISGGGTFNATAVTTAGTVSHPTELLDATSAPFTRTLPTAVGFTGEYNLIASTTGTNEVTVATTSSQTIIAPGAAGTTAVALGTPASGAPYAAITVVSDGSNWRIV